MVNLENENFLIDKQEDEKCYTPKIDPLSILLTQSNNNFISEIEKGLRCIERGEVMTVDEAFDSIKRV